MAAMATPEWNRRTFMKAGIAIFAGTAALLPRRDAVAGACKKAGMWDKLDDAIDPDLESNPGKLAKFILIDKNTQYASAGIYTLHKKVMGQQIQRDRAAGTEWDFGGVKKLIAKSLRLPYSGTAAGGHCTPEHVLIGYEKTGTEVSGDKRMDWVPGSTELEVLELDIVTFMKGDNVSQAVKGWPTFGGDCSDPYKGCDDTKQRMWSFRGVSVRVDRAIRIPYVIQEGGSGGWPSSMSGMRAAPGTDR